MGLSPGRLAKVGDGAWLHWHFWTPSCCMSRGAHDAILAATQVLKFSESGTELLALGEALVPGHDAQHFCKPTAVSARLPVAGLDLLRV